jgi:hypothetical protein
MSRLDAAAFFLVFFKSETMHDLCYYGHIISPATTPLQQDISVPA